MHLRVEQQKPSPSDPRHSPYQQMHSAITTRHVHTQLMLNPMMEQRLDSAFIQQSHMMLTYELRTP